MTRSLLPVVALFSLSPIFVTGTATAQDPGTRQFRPQDIHREKAVGDMAVSADGEWLAYTVTTTDVAKDRFSSDLYMVNWDGSSRLQLTHSADSSESNPRFSPDGKYLAFIAARNDGSADNDDAPANKAQVWLLNRSGGEAQRLTEMPGGVSGFEWSPDSSRLVLVSNDPEPEKDESATHDTPKPIVIDRYQFKRDVIGYLGDRRRRLYLFDVPKGSATLLTPGPFDSTQPAWGPHGDVIAFTSKRQGDPDRHDNSDIYLIDAQEGAVPRQLTTWEGPDSNPVFSPDGSRIAYLQGGPPKYAGYDPDDVAIISVDGGEAKLLTAQLDRYFYQPAWSDDGKHVYFRLADDRIESVAAVPANGGDIAVLFPTRDKPGVAQSIVVGPRGVAALVSDGTRPYEIYRVADGAALTDHNADFVSAYDWASVEAYDAVSADGVRVGSVLFKPPGYRAGKAYPTIAYIHGGPVAQDGFEFWYMPHALAAQGYVVVNPNYRGSSGRGREFARAIYADWGNLEIQDIHAVMDKLVEDGIADPERLGIGGWSYGGINTNFAIASDTRFAAAVSGASASNYIAGYGTDQYIRQYENELGPPWETPDNYLRMSYPFFKADRIKTPTLFLCGELDFNVPLLNSEQMYQALRSLNVPTQLVIYPGQYHGLSKPSYLQDRVERLIDWYGRYLGSDANALTRVD